MAAPARGLGVAWECCCAQVDVLTAGLLAHLPTVRRLKPVRLPVSDRWPGLGRMTVGAGPGPPHLSAARSGGQSHSSGSAWVLPDGEEDGGQRLGPCANSATPVRLMKQPRIKTDRLLETSSPCGLGGQRGDHSIASVAWGDGGWFHSCDGALPSLASPTLDSPWCFWPKPPASLHKQRHSHTRHCHHPQTLLPRPPSLSRAIFVARLPHGRFGQHSYPAS